MNKISVMIVDDEKLAVDDLVNIIDWREEGFEIVETAVNGKQALSKIDKIHPQVIFTDIKMPYMDGIELIKKIREFDQTTKIILLTAYKDFAYAKTAIKYGITDYLLKNDICPDTIRKILQELTCEISRESMTENTLNQKILSDYFDGAESIGHQKLFIESCYYTVIERDIPVNITDEEMEGGFSLKLSEISDLLSEEAKKLNLRILAESKIRHDQILQMISVDDVSQNAVDTIIMEYARRILMSLRDINNIPCTVYYVVHKMQLYNFKELYISKKSYFKRKYLVGPGQIYDLQTVRWDVGCGDITVDSEYIESCVEKLDAESIYSYLDNLFRSVIDSNSYTCLQHVSRGLYTILKKKSSNLKDGEKPDLSLAANLDQWRDALSILQWMKKEYGKIVDRKVLIRSKKYSKAVINTMDVIWNNYQDQSLNINFIADSVYLSVGHLCSLFKKETGKTVNDFITEVRIGQAKKLLLSGGRKIYEISEAVGYKSSQYFSQVFYKTTGKYPGEYQKKNGKEN